MLNNVNINKYQIKYKNTQKIETTNKFCLQVPTISIFYPLIDTALFQLQDQFKELHSISRHFEFLHSPNHERNS